MNKTSALKKKRFEFFALIFMFMQIIKNGIKFYLHGKFEHFYQYAKQTIFCLFQFFFALYFAVWKLMACWILVSISGMVIKDVLTAKKWHLQYKNRSVFKSLQTDYVCIVHFLFFCIWIMFFAASVSFPF